MSTFFFFLFQNVENVNHFYSRNKENINNFHSEIAAFIHKKLPTFTALVFSRCLFSFCFKDISALFLCFQLCALEAVALVVCV